MTLDQLQIDVDVWHRGRYPTATPSDVALKLAEETGEACRQVLERRHPSLHRPYADNLAEELADVIIAAAALAARTNIDLDQAVWRKLAQLEQR